MYGSVCEASEIVDNPFKAKPLLQESPSPPPLQSRDQVMYLSRTNR